MSFLRRQESRAFQPRKTRTTENGRFTTEGTEDTEKEIRRPFLIPFFSSADYADCADFQPGTDNWFLTEWMRGRVEA